MVKSTLILSLSQLVAALWIEAGTAHWNAWHGSPT
jgi:hypothetical protein